VAHGPMTSSKNPKSTPFMTTPTNNLTQIEIFTLFLTETTRLSASLEGLNSSIAQPAGKL